MDRHSRTLLALEILKEYGRVEDYHLPAEALVDSLAATVVPAARSILLNEAGDIIDEMVNLGFTISHVSDKTEIDCGTLSRAHNRPEEVQMGIDKLRELVRKLRQYKGEAKDERIHTLLPLDPPLLTALDFCTAAKIEDETSSEIGRIIFKNIVSCLTRKFDERLALPDKVGGCLVQIGPPEYNLFGFQVEGTTELEQLKHQIHELKHILERKEAELARKEKELEGISSKGDERRKGPRSLY